MVPWKAVPIEIGAGRDQVVVVGGDGEAACDERAFKMAKGRQVVPGPRGEPLDSAISSLWRRKSQE